MTPILAGGGLSWNDVARRALFLPEQASTFSYQVDHLHFFVIGTTLVASTILGLSTIAFFVRYRIRGAQPTTPRITPPRWVEMLIVFGPLALFLLWFFIGFHDYVQLQSPPPDAMDVYVTGKQWMWEFSYPDGPNAISELRVPVDRPVRLLITSRDVVHSLYVPAFRIKQDAVPGRYNQIWFQATKTGTYELLCAEFCGLSHSGMRGDVVVMPQEEFDAWKAEQKNGLAAVQDSGPGDMASIGQKMAVQYECVKCHTVDGSAHIGPTWRDLYGSSVKLSDGTSVVADEAYLTESMMDPMAKIVAGFSPVMPTYQGKLAGPDAAAIVEYIKSLRSPDLAGVREPVRGHD